MKTITLKKPAKPERQRLLLLGLVELFVQTGKPVGSNTLRENGFEMLSSATIRNYFSKLENEGLLKQQHSSGGRIPTPLAYKLYAEDCLHRPLIEDKDKKQLRAYLAKENREIAAYLQKAAEKISEMTKSAVFLSAPRFDQDFVLDIKLMGIDATRFLCAIITDFGLVHTEVLHTEKKLSNFTLKRLEAYFHFRMTGIQAPDLTKEEEQLAAHFYKEIMLRHIISHTHFNTEDMHKTGFSQLLNYPDFNDASALANGLSLFENPNLLRSLLSQCVSSNALSCFIGDDLPPLIAPSCSVIAIPYRINQTPVGAIALLGPNRIPYRHLFGILQAASDTISETITKSMYKFKISFRQPNPSSLTSKYSSASFVDQTHCLLLEDKTLHKKGVPT